MKLYLLAGAFLTTIAAMPNIKWQWTDHRKTDDNSDSHMSMLFYLSVVAGLVVVLLVWQNLTADGQTEFERQKNEHEKGRDEVHG